MYSASSSLLSFPILTYSFQTSIGFSLAISSLFSLLQNSLRNNKRKTSGVDITVLPLFTSRHGFRTWGDGTFLALLYKIDSFPRRSHTLFGGMDGETSLFNKQFRPCRGKLPSSIHRNRRLPPHSNSGNPSSHQRSAALQEKTRTEINL